MEKTNVEKTELTHAQKSFVNREHICPLCNTRLTIKVKTYLENFKIAEEAYCNTCDVVTRTKDHKMQ